MKRLAAIFLLVSAIGPVAAQDDGMVTRASKHSVAETTARLRAAIESSGIYKVFY